jgi:hypothetical protein
MTEHQMHQFVQRFSNAWARKEAALFQALWHPHGVLIYPYANRRIAGREIGKLNELTIQVAPALTWTLLGWTWRDDVVVIEWRSTNVYGERRLEWCGVDRITLEDGKIIEEIVYSDTTPLREIREGRPFEPLIKLPGSL